MSSEKQLQDANRLTSLTYMISACLAFSIENLTNHLDKCNLQLQRDDKRLFNRVLQQTSQLQTNLKSLENLAIQVLDKDEGALLSYEDSIQIYYSLFMTILDRAGTDNLYDLRMMSLIDIIGKYKSLLNLPGMGTQYHKAFAQVVKGISSGKYTQDDFKNLLELYEDGTEETKG